MQLPIINRKKASLRKQNDRFLFIELKKPYTQKINDLKFYYKESLKGFNR